jgi:uncharacterized protein involved in exopolysaccharide biosynthesis
MQPVHDNRREPQLHELERRVAEQAELAKQALQEYREAIRGESVRAPIKRRVQNAVARYMKALTDLNQLRSGAHNAK